MSDAKKKPEGGSSTPAAEIKPGGAAKAATRMSSYIQTLATLDRVLGKTDVNTAKRCLTFLAGQYGITVGETPVIFAGSGEGKP